MTRIYRYVKVRRMAIDDGRQRAGERARVMP